MCLYDAQNEFMYEQYLIAEKSTEKEERLNCFFKGVQNNTIPRKLFNHIIYVLWSSRNCKYSFTWYKLIL